ncbi:MAG: Fe-S cluster assembly protein SufD [Verrucomicrobia bacterium]|nr:Fe-S cluster assembly protein SufD [Verrucomicrobiota bacterium]
MSTLTESTSVIGAFTPEIFAAHLGPQEAAPAWWLGRKRAAYEKFASFPLPKRTDESWRFSGIGTLTLDGFRVQPAVANGLSIDAPFGPPALTFVNNAIAARTASPPELATRGVIVTTLADAAVRHAGLLRAHFMAQPQKLGSEKFASLHTAFMHDGAFIYIPRGVEVSAPLVVTHAATGDGTAVFPHTLVIAEENSKVTVVDYFLSADEEPLPHFACGANDLYAGHGAQLTYIGAQHWSVDTLSFQFNSTVVRRDARVQSLNLHLGGRQARHESLSQLQAPGAFSEMLALTVADGAQEFDQRTLQIHQAPNTKSDLLYKNALRDRARTIFSGLIIVDPDAQKTDAYQSNRNLMLSEEAEANSLPGLEIQANDVRCTHGATSSRIDPEQEFYLQSRGISKEAADELLTFGFFEEVLNRLASHELHAALSGLIQTRF